MYTYTSFLPSFSPQVGLWKIMKRFLDPTVAAKITLTSKVPREDFETTFGLEVRRERESEREREREREGAGEREVFILRGA